MAEDVTKVLQGQDVSSYRWCENAQQGSALCAKRSKIIVAPSKFQLTVYDSLSEEACKSNANDQRHGSGLKVDMEDNLVTEKDLSQRRKCVWKKFRFLRFFYDKIRQNGITQLISLLLYRMYHFVLANRTSLLKFDVSYLDQFSHDKSGSNPSPHVWTPAALLYIL